MNTLCPICEAPVLDYAPGESCTEYDGIRYHPVCLAGEQLMEWTARHIEANKDRDARFMEACRRVDAMQDKVEIARVIRDAWGPMTYMIEEEA